MEDGNLKLEEIECENVVDVPEINIIIPNIDGPNMYVENIPLFIKKLWKMVNEKSIETIISWSKEGNSFVIHNQHEFVSKILPKYFKHNNMASFVRQLNLYDFHKVQNIDKDQLEFIHCFFLRDCPELTPLIKRKYSTAKTKTATKQTSDANVDEIGTALKDLKKQSDAIESEIAKLGEERASLYREIGSLRVKYSKQSKIVNKLIHFLISYMHKHPNSVKRKKPVDTKYQEFLKQGPKIMELESHKSPSDFWSDFDTQHGKNDNIVEPDTYIVTEPECGLETVSDPQNLLLENICNTDTLTTPEVLIPYKDSSVSTTLDPSLPSQSIATLQTSSSSLQTASTSESTSAPSSSDNIAYCIDNTQVELTNIKELLKNLSSDDIADFYKLINENLKVQEPPENLTTEYGSEPEFDDTELMALAELSDINNEQEEMETSEIIK